MNCAHCGNALIPGWPTSNKVEPGYTGGLEFYNMDVQQVCMYCWTHMFEDRGPNNQRRVAATMLGNEEIWVSTVLIGHNMNFLGDIPIIFETMIFDAEGTVADYQERYATKQAALAGHDRAVAWARENLFLSEADVTELYRLTDKEDT